MTPMLLENIMPALTPAVTMRHRNLTLVPLMGGGRRFQDYLVSNESVEPGGLAITEARASGAVGKLLAFNFGAQPILLLSGEQFPGNRENRVLNTTVMLHPKSKTLIPISFMKASPWQHVNPSFKGGDYAPGKVRQHLSRDVTRSLRTRGRPEGSQAAIRSYGGSQTTTQTDTPAEAMADATGINSEVLDSYQATLPYRQGSCGVMAAVQGRLLAADIFDSPSTLKALWPSLLASYAVDAEMTSQSVGSTFTTKTAASLLAELTGQECAVYPGVGQGYDLRFEGTELFGHALHIDNGLPCLSVFPADSPIGR